MHKTATNGLITIKGLKASCKIGVKPEERLKHQDLVIDIVLSLDLSKAAASDDIKDTLDYDKLVDKVVKFIERSGFRLIEKLAYEVAKLVKNISNANQVKVAVKKPAALKEADYAAVEVSL